MPPYTTPHKLFEVWSPDDVAECLPGVDANWLYLKLWDLVIRYAGKPRSEVPDDFSERCLANWWDELSWDDQRRLNNLAEVHEVKYG